jgi:hypothetical protein
MRWITNCSSTEIQKYIQRGLIIGKPEPSYCYSLEQMYSYGLVGVYTTRDDNKIGYKYQVNDYILFQLDKHLCMGQVCGFVPVNAKNKAGAYVVQIKDKYSILLYEEEITGRVELNYKST